MDSAATVCLYVCSYQFVVMQNCVNLLNFSFSVLILYNGLAISRYIVILSSMWKCPLLNFICIPFSTIDISYSSLALCKIGWSW